MLWFMLWFAAEAASPKDVQQTVDEVVEHYRMALVLAAADLDDIRDRQRPVLGKLLWYEKHQALDRLAGWIDEDIAESAASDFKKRPGLLDALLDGVESGDLRDGDKLAFRVLLDTIDQDLADAGVADTRKGSRWTERLAVDRAALDDVYERYAEEMRKLLPKVGTRGMTLTREAWDAYLGAVQAELSVDQVFERYDEDLQALVGTVRGSGRDPLEIYGFDLPEGTFVLTYDDGPSDAHTPVILDHLKEAGAPAIFFEVGENVGTLTDEGVEETATAAMTRRILDEGHLLANHSLSHQNLPKVGDVQLAEQIDESRQILEEVSGVDVQLFRPPYGGRDGRVLNALEDRQMKAYLWNVDSRDWADPIPESIAATVLKQVDEQQSGVILLHDVHPQTAAATPLILEGLKERGIQLVLWDGDEILDTNQTRSDEGATMAEAGVYEDSWGVVIGINDYATWPKLSYATSDAEGVRDTLVGEFGFAEDHVITLFDQEATREEILRVLGDELPGKVGENDRVFVFYAGHGITRELPSGTQRGYIVPVDADTKSFAATAISMTALQDVSEGLAAKHVFFVMDACYSGIALTRGVGYQGSPDRYLREVTRRTARQILTAGGAEEEVADVGPGGHSIFTWTLLQGLDGQADLNQDGFLTASELSSFVAPRVSSLSRQTPAFGNLVGSGGGEFVFQLAEDAGFLSDSSESEAEVSELEKEKEELMAELAAMQEELSRLKVDRGGAPEVEEGAASSQAYNAWGLQLFKDGKLEQALGAFEQATEADPSNAQAVNNQGFVLYKLGRHADAIPLLERTLELAPERHVAYLNLGDAHKELEQHHEAVMAYETYLDRVPDSPVRPKIETYLAEHPEETP